MNDHLDKILAVRLKEFQEGKLNCAEAVLYVLCDYYKLEIAVCPRIATAFGGGLCGTQNVCGALSGGLMVIGLWHGRELGGDKLPAYGLGKRFMEWFKQQQSATLCAELTETNFADPAEMAAFRMPGGTHERLCQQIVRDTCHWLTENF